MQEVKIKKRTEQEEIEDKDKVEVKPDFPRIGEKIKGGAEDTF